MVELASICPELSGTTASATAIGVTVGLKLTRALMQQNIPTNRTVQVSYIVEIDPSQPKSTPNKRTALTPETTGMSKEEICVFTRIACSKAGATTRDRPEWVVANPLKAQVYCCLTNNRNRGIKPNAGGDPTPVGGPNPRENNICGQIVKWVPDDGDHTADTFTWDLFVVAVNPLRYDDANAGSGNINPDNMINSPDGLAFDLGGNFWIQTDGEYSNEDDFEGMGNNQMLLANVETGEIQRFLVEPKECEVTGITWNSDRRTMFVRIQHPGETNPDECHFPDGGRSVPRSPVIAIYRTDGGMIDG